MSYSADYRRDPYRQSSRDPHRRSLSGVKLRLLIAAAIVLFSIVSYYSKGERNPVTGEHQRVNMTVKDEILMGLQGAPEMGHLSNDPVATRKVEIIGARLQNAMEQMLLEKEIRNPYPFEFHLLADRDMINAFALPGGQIFITEGLYSKLTQDGQLAGILGHEMGHVLERHSAQRMAKGSLIGGIAGAAGVAGGDINSTRAAAWVGNVFNMKYGRDDELESDRWAVDLMVRAGYNPEHMLTVMDILEQSSGGAGPPEFLSTHPKPANRREYLQRIINERFPEDISPDLY